jgi:hypothetical protein
MHQGDASTGSPTDSEGRFDISDADTLPAGSDYEKSREHLRTSHSQGLTRPLSGVDVQQAEEDFAELNKELSRLSIIASRASGIPSNVGYEQYAADVENSTGEEEPWDLETTLHGNRAAEDEAGIKPKRIGRRYSSCLISRCPRFKCLT